VQEAAPHAQGWEADGGAGKAISGIEHGDSKGGNRLKRQRPSQVPNGWSVRDLEQELERQLNYSTRQGFGDLSKRG